MKDNRVLIEAVLSLEIEPVDEGQISRITGLSRDEVIANLEILKNHYDTDAHGIQLVKSSSGWSFLPKESLWQYLKVHYGRERENTLTRAAMETLSIIAYSQPIARSEIESIRGVGVDGVIRALRDKNLIKEIGRRDTPGRPALYGTTKEFLKRFNLRSIAELPRFNEIDNKKFSADGSS